MSNILSIEIDNQIIKIVESNKKGDTLSVYNCITFDVPDGLIEDGEINDMGILEKLIKNKLIQHNIKTKKSHLLINSNLIIIRSIVLPYINNKKETMSMIKYELEHIMSADINQFKIVCKQEEIYIKEGIKKAKYIVNLTHKKIYEQYIELFKRLKIQLISLDGSFNSLSKITSKNVNNESITTVSTMSFVRLNMNSIAFSVVKNGVVNFSRTTYLNLDEQIEIESVSESLEDTEQFKILIQDKSDGTKEKEDYLNIMFDEISKYLRYYNTINKESIIEKIYIYGNGFDSSMVELLSNEIDIKIEIVEQLSGIEIINEGLFKNFETNECFYINEYFNLMLSFYFNNMDINYLTDKNKKHLLIFNIGVSVMAVVLIIILIFIYNGLNYFFTNRYLAKEIETMNAFIHNENNEKLNLYAESLKTNISKLEAYKSNSILLNELAADEDLISSDMLNEIKAALPSKTIIRSVIIDEYSMQLICTSSYMSDIALFEHRLKNIYFVDAVHIPVIESQNSSDNVNIYLYSVVCHLRSNSDDAE